MAPLEIIGEARDKVDISIRVEAEVLWDKHMPQQLPCQSNWLDKIKERTKDHPFNKSHVNN